MSLEILPALYPVCMRCRYEPALCRFKPCGHRVLCKGCSKDWDIGSRTTCPFCDVKIQQVRCVKNVQWLHVNIVDDIYTTLQKTGTAVPSVNIFFTRLLDAIIMEPRIGRALTTDLHDSFLRNREEGDGLIEWYHDLITSMSIKIDALYQDAITQPYVDDDDSYLYMCADLQRACVDVMTTYNVMQDMGTAVHQCSFTPIQDITRKLDMVRQDGETNELLHKSVSKLSVGVVGALFIYLMQSTIGYMDCAGLPVVPNFEDVPYGHWEGASDRCNRNCGERITKPCMLGTADCFDHYGPGETLRDVQNGSPFSKNPKDEGAPFERKKAFKQGKIGMHTKRTDRSAVWVQDGILAEERPSDHTVCVTENQTQYIMDVCLELFKWLAVVGGTTALGKDLLDILVRFNDLKNPVYEDIA